MQNATELPRAERRRLEKQSRKKPKYMIKQVRRDGTAVGFFSDKWSKSDYNRGMVRLRMRHTKKQHKEIPKVFTVRKAKFRRWKRKHGIEVVRYDYPHLGSTEPLPKDANKHMSKV